MNAQTSVLPTERQVQRAILAMCGVSFPDVLIIHIPNGVPVFSGCSDDTRAEAILSERGLSPDSRQILDPTGPVSLTIWRTGSQAS